MSKGIEELYAQWLDAKTTELQQAAQQLIRSEDPEAAFRAALNQPSEPSDLMEAFADQIKPDEADGPFIPELNRRISREEAQTLLTRWNQPVSPFVAQESAGESMTDALNEANEQWELAQKQRQATSRAAHDEGLHGDYLQRTTRTPKGAVT